MLESLNYSFRNPKNIIWVIYRIKQLRNYKKNHGVLRGPQLNEATWVNKTIHVVNCEFWYTWHSEPTRLTCVEVWTYQGAPHGQPEQWLPAASGRLCPPPPTVLILHSPIFPLSRPLKKHPAANWFATDADMKQAVASCLQTPHSNFFCDEIQALVPQRDKCLNVSGDHVEVWCVPSATICHLYFKAIPVQA